jgi:hypothetical protein
MAIRSKSAKATDSCRDGTPSRRQFLGGFALVSSARFVITEPPMQTVREALPRLSLVEIRAWLIRGIRTDGVPSQERLIAILDGFDLTSAEKAALLSDVRLTSERPSLV